ncbi:MAG: hypothetical protein R3352_10525 [Salinisphaeraceae bacterium]|nr:hypothetical protein [Salinisphaeraceae bacterium]
MSLYKRFLALAITLFMPATALADTATSHHPDGHAPLGVMGDHMHKQGEWMFSYRFMRMDMEGNRDGENDLSAAEVLAQGFMAAPLQMTTEMHMVGAMYAPTDDVTLMAMFPLIEKTMDHVNGMGREFTTETDGLGDLKVSAMFRWLDDPHRKLHFSIGLSLPTGSIDEKDVIPTPMGPRLVRLPYPMQLGSGTTDFISGITYNGLHGAWSWGAQASSVLRVEGENENGYALGNEGLLTAWAARRFNHNVSASLRLAAKRWGNIDGADPELNPNMVPTADPNRRAGKRIDLGLGVNLLGTGSVVGHRLALEWLEPVKEDLDGPQLKSDGMLLLGWQKAF